MDVYTPKMATIASSPLERAVLDSQTPQARLQALYVNYKRIQAQKNSRQLASILIIVGKLKTVSLSI